MKIQSGERTLRTGKVGVTKGQAREQGEEEERRRRGGGEAGGNDYLCYFFFNLSHPVN